MVTAGEIRKLAARINKTTASIGTLWNTLQADCAALNQAVGSSAFAAGPGGARAATNGGTRTGAGRRATAPAH